MPSLLLLRCLSTVRIGSFTDRLSVPNSGPDSELQAGLTARMRSNSQKLEATQKGSGEIPYHKIVDFGGSTGETHDRAT